MTTAHGANPNLDIASQALQWHSAGRKLALATVIATYGSAPRPTGSMLVVDNQGNFAGSVSGGCIEGAVVNEALEVIEAGNHREISFGVSDEDAWEVGLACGGEITILLEAMTANRAALLTKIASAQTKRRSLATITDLTEGKAQLFDPNVEDESFDQDLAGKAKVRLATDASGIEAIKDRRHFISPHNPPLRLVIIGAVHVTQILVPMARLLGIECVVIDPRSSWIKAERFANTEVKLMGSWPQEALQELGIDSRTAIATLTHDPKIDDPALAVAVASDALYVGALGSKKTHAKRLARLEEEGVASEQLARIHAPIGLDIKASSAAEIALAILAQIVNTVRKINN